MKENKSKLIQIRASDNDLSHFDNLSSMLGVKRSEALRVAVKIALEVTTERKNSSPQPERA